MVFSLNLSRARQKRHLGDRLPITHREGAQIAVGIFWLLFGGVFTVLAIFFFRTASINSDPTPIPAYLLLGIFLILGLAAMAVGLSAFLHQVDLMIDAEGVRGLQRNIKGTRTWNEPLSIYSGVLGEEEYHSGGKHHSAYTLYKIVLKHSRDEEFDVLLYSSRSGQQHRDEIEMFARLLERPVLVEEAGGRYAERAVEDLDKSVKELVEEGKLGARFNPNTLPKGDRLTLEKEGKGYVFTHHYRGVGSFLFSFLFLGAGLGMLYWYFGPGLPASAGGSPWVAAALGVVFTLVGGYMMVFCAMGSSTLRVFPDELQSYTEILGWRVSDKRAASSDVEEVTVAKNNRGGSSCKRRAIEDRFHSASKCSTKMSFSSCVAPSSQPYPGDVNPDNSRRRTMGQESSQYLNRSHCVLGCRVSVQFVLFGFAKNRASYSARSSLIHSYGYASADDRTDYLARFPLNSEPFMNYPG